MRIFLAIRYLNKLYGNMKFYIATEIILIIIAIRCYVFDIK